MTLRTRVAIVCLLIALPVAAVATFVVERMRMADARLTLERVVSSQINDQVKERCESDPTWFLTGPLEGRPAGGVFVETSPDELPPRPKVTNEPFELFAYDEEFVGSSSASARFPAELRRQLRASAEPAIVPYQTSAGTGVQMAIGTGWIGSPCMYFLGRLAPPPHQMRTRVLVFLGAYALSLALALGAAWPTVARVRTLARDPLEQLRPPAGREVRDLRVDALERGQLALDGRVPGAEVEALGGELVEAALVVAGLA